MPMIGLQKPTQGELKSIVANMRLESAKTGIIPLGVKRAKGDDAIRAAWINEATRFFYLVKMRERQLIRGDFSHAIDADEEPS